MSSLEKCFANEIQNNAKDFFQEDLISQSRLIQSEIESLTSTDKREENMKNKFVQLTDLKEAIRFDERLISAELEFYKTIEHKEAILVHLS